MKTKFASTIFVAMAPAAPAIDAMVHLFHKMLREVRLVLFDCMNKRLQYWKRAGGGQNEKEICAPRDTADSKCIKLYFRSI